MTKEELIEQLEDIMLDEKEVYIKSGRHKYKIDEVDVDIDNNILLVEGEQKRN